MKAVANLVTVAAEAEIAQWATLDPGMDPKAEDPLVDPAKLAGTTHDTAAIDPDGEVERGAVFECKEFGAELGASIEGEGRVGAEGLGDAPKAKALGSWRRESSWSLLLG